MSLMEAAYANTGQTKRLQPLEPIKQIKAGVLDVGYYDIGASDGPPVLLLHGWPYDIHSYVDVARMEWVIITTRHTAANDRCGSIAGGVN